MEKSIQVLREECRQLAIRDRHHESLKFLEQAPPEVIQNDPDLSFWHALGLLTTVRYKAGKTATESFLRNHASSGEPLSVGRGHLLRSHLCIMDGDTEASYQHELKVVSVLPDNAYHERLRSWATIDTMAGHIGDTARVEQAAEALADVRNNLPLDQSWWYSFVVPNRADIMAKRGLLDKAESLLRAYLPTMPDEGAEVVRLRLAVIALERQDPTAAAGWLEEVTQDGSTAYWSMEARIIASKVAALLGDSDQAMRILQEGIAEKSKNEVRAELYRAQLQMAELWIREGEIDLADSWLQLASKALDPWPRTFGHPIPNLIKAELEMAKGNWQLAITLLEALVEEGQRRNHTGLLVGIYSHLAYSWAALKRNANAQQMAQLAINAGKEGAFSRSFIVFGQDVREQLSQPPAIVLDAPQGASSAEIILSERELEVLQLVAQGMRNAEIAESLFLSVSTVKNHLANIYRRLGVSRRQDAVAAARTRKLLGPRESHVL